MSRSIPEIVSRALIGLGLAVVAHGSAQARQGVDAEAALAKALAGRTAGQPVSCISLSRNVPSSIVGDAIVYKSSGARWYVNRPDGGACPLARGRAIITRIPGTRLCSGDIVNVVDLVSRFDYGGCGLGQFVPYERASAR